MKAVPVMSLTASGTCQGIKDFAVNACNWVGKTISTGCNTASTVVSATAQKAATVSSPYLSAVQTFASQNKGAFAGLVVTSAVAGVVLLSITHALFSRGVDPTGEATKHHHHHGKKHAQKA